MLTLDRDYGLAILGVQIHGVIIFLPLLCQNASTAIFEAYFSSHKDISIAAADYYMYFTLLCCTSVNKFYSFITFNLVINTVNLLLKLSCFDTLFLHTFSLSSVIIAPVPLHNFHCKFFM